MRRFLEELDRLGFKSARIEETHGYDECEHADYTLKAREGVVVEAEMMEHAETLAKLIHEGAFDALKKKGREPSFGDNGGYFGVDIDIQKSLEKEALVMNWDSTDREEIEEDCDGDSRTYSWDEFKKLFDRPAEFEEARAGLLEEEEVLLHYLGGGDSGCFNDAETENNRLVKILLKHEERFLRLVTHDWYNNEGGGATIAFKTTEEGLVVSGYGFYNTIENIETGKGMVEVPFEEPPRPRLKKQGPSAGPGM